MPVFQRTRETREGVIDQIDTPTDELPVNMTFHEGIGWMLFCTTSIFKEMTVQERVDRHCLAT
jgi:hypothetical protein